MDIKRALREAISTGKVYLGYKSTIKELEKKKIKLIIIANNCPTEYYEEMRKKTVKIYRYDGNNVELGATCGKPFSVSVLGIANPGGSEILLLKNSQENVPEN